MSVWTVKFLFIFCSLFIKSAIFGVIDNSIDQYAINSESGENVCKLPPELVQEIAGYQGTVDKIINEITNGRFKGNTWDSLAELTDSFGPRMSCSSGLDKAIDYALDKLKKAGLENVHTEEANVTNWVRGFESAQLVSPWKRNLRILGLGSSVGTPRGGIIADVIAFESFEEFEKFPEDKVKGKIVLFVPQFTTYGKTAKYRTQSASVASKKGAVAALVRSITPFSIATPHTGNQHYEEGVRKIPVASVTVEDAEMMLRMYRRGQQVTVNLEISDFNRPDCVSRNTIAELQGSKFKDTSVVVVSGHFDSWDVGVGAMDDGGGSMIAWKTAEFLKAMNLRPKRTIRTILWTGEEQGLKGSEPYMKSHKANEKKEFNLFIESDSGTFNPKGLTFSGNADASCIIKEILKLMKPLGATAYQDGADGAPDIDWWSTRGFPTMSLLSEDERYFWYHHTDADTMGVYSKEVLDKCAALWAATSYVIADLSVDLPRTLR